MENKWLKYGIALVAGIPVALCLSVVCCSTSSLSSDILADGLAVDVCLWSSFIGSFCPVDISFSGTD